MEQRRDGKMEVSTRGGCFLFNQVDDVELERSQLRSLLHPLVSMSRARKMRNETMLRRHEPIATGEGVVITSTPLGFSSLSKHAGGEWRCKVARMEVDGRC
jgi:hypothetical protein